MMLRPEIREHRVREDECAAFQARIIELMGEGTELLKHPHLQECDRCRALLLDLIAIADAARSLMRFEIEPGEDIWRDIQVALGQRQTANTGHFTP